MAIGSAYLQYQGTKAQYKATQNQAKAQAQAAQHDSRLQTEAAEVAEENTRMQVERRISSARAAAGASGVDVGFGSPLANQLEIARMGEYEAQIAGYQSRQAASQSAYRAVLARTEAKSLGKLGPFMARTTAASSLLSSGSSLAAGAASSGMFK